MTICSKYEVNDLGFVHRMLECEVLYDDVLSSYRKVALQLKPQGVMLPCAIICVPGPSLRLP